MLLIPGNRAQSCPWSPLPLITLRLIRWNLTQSDSYLDRTAPAATALCSKLIYSHGTGSREACASIHSTRIPTLLPLSAAYCDSRHLAFICRQSSFFSISIFMQAMISILHWVLLTMSEKILKKTRCVSVSIFLSMILKLINVLVASGCSF